MQAQGAARGWTLGIAVLVSACSPALAVNVDFTEATCVSSDAEVVLVIEEGACSARAGALAWSGSPEDAVVTLEPGSYCIDALALRTGEQDHGRLCRVEAMARENRRLPQQRGPIELVPSCGAANELTDDLLREEAGCSGECDVARCVCSLACPAGEASAHCVPPIEVTSLVMGNDYACGLATDRRSFSCWGIGGGGSERVFGWTDDEAGVATTGLLPLGPTDEYLLFDGDAENFCVRSSVGSVRCGLSEPRFPDADATDLNLVAAGEDFICGGIAGLLCSDGGLRRNLADFENPTELSAGSNTLCGIVSGVIHCTRPTIPANDCGLLGGTNCPWYFESCGPAECTAQDIVATDTMAPLPALRHPAWIDLDLGWNRGCALDTLRRLWCWNNVGAESDPARLPVPQPTDPRGLVPTLIEGVTAREVSVGREHVCTREEGGAVFCWQLMQDGVDSFVRAGVQAFPGEGPITSFVAGPDGITCAIRSVEGTPNRVECFQLEGFTGSEGLLGRAHTRDLDPSGVDPDRADLAVCP